MAPKASSSTNTVWSHEFDTLRRENLFRNPPKDHTAYPALQQAVRPHIDSFNALFEKDGLIAQGLRDIGTKTFLDGDERAPPAGKNRMSMKIKEVFLEKAQLPASNKFSTRNREILPAECRERHVTYRGKMSARLEFRINNGDPKEFVREIGQLPIMLMVCRRMWSGTSQILIIIAVKSMSSGEQFTGATRATERRGGGVRWILCGKWD
jgi:DNA-directed RNA polymerase I subunit RPA2